jgi:hypothetical protein
VDQGTDASASRAVVSPEQLREAIEKKSDLLVMDFGGKQPSAKTHGEVVLKKFLIYLSAIAICVAVLPIPAEAGSRHKKKDPNWGRYAGRHGRDYYSHYYPNYHWRYRPYHRHHRYPTWYYDRYYRYPYWYYGYASRPAIGFRIQLY